MGEKDNNQTQETNPIESNETNTTLIPNIDTNTYQEKGLPIDELEKR